MNPTDLTNGKADDLFYPGNYGAEMKLGTMRPAERAALRSRLAELRTIPRGQWVDHDVIDLGPDRPGAYAVFFGDDGIAWVVPEPDGRFRLTGLGSQETLEAFRREAEEGEGEKGADE
jgi:hypothetical protein